MELFFLVLFLTYCTILGPVQPYTLVCLSHANITSRDVKSLVLGVPTDPQKWLVILLDHSFREFHNDPYHPMPIYSIIEGSLEVKLPTIWTVEKQRWEESEETRSEERRCRCAKHCVFPMICGSVGRKVGSLKRRVRSQLARWETKNCTPLWREARFQVKMYKTHQVRTNFGGSDVEKMSKKCTPLWREAHFEVKSVKNWGFWVFFDVKMSKK